MSNETSVEYVGWSQIAVKHSPDEGVNPMLNTETDPEVAQFYENMKPKGTCR